MCERTDLQFLQDILESIDAALYFVMGFDIDAFEEDRKTRSATIRELEIIGEAASRVSSTKKDSCFDVPWRLMKDFRNVLSHEYFGVNNQIIWDIVQNKLPNLKLQIQEIIRLEIDSANKPK
jgi:uncharacterized protein with HEPN domain